TGEALLTRAGFRPVIRTRAVDIINPDVANCGGILELMHIAAAAESEAIAVSPHNYNSTTMALSATVHASACLPNFIITEDFLPFADLGRRPCPTVLLPVPGLIARSMDTSRCRKGPVSGWTSTKQPYAPKRESNSRPEPSAASKTKVLKNVTPAVGALLLSALGNGALICYDS